MGDFTRTYEVIRDEQADKRRTMIAEWQRDFKRERRTTERVLVWLITLGTIGASTYYLFWGL